MYKQISKLYIILPTWKLNIFQILEFIEAFYYFEGEREEGEGDGEGNGDGRKEGRMGAGRGEREWN